MLDFSKKTLFYILMIISSISFINLVLLYWFPMPLPLSSYLVIGLAQVAYFFKLYYLLPISIVICVLMFLGTLSILKKRIVLPVILFVYYLCDLSFLAYNVFDAWINEKYFIVTQAIQTIISITVIAFMCAYFVCLWKTKKKANGES